MSGGVDSSVTASLLKRSGYAVDGFFMLLPLPGVEGHVRRVRAIADHLGIRLHCIDMREVFNRDVVDYFITTYRNGYTPNPCIICNRRIKFGKLLEIMQDRGMARIATGHYARLTKTPDGRTVIRRGRDRKKDQSYFLCRLSADQLGKIVLPLGEFTKEQVYRLASAMNLRGMHSSESQDICFLAGRTVSTFFAHQGVVDTPGDIADTAGRVIGEHRGLWHYTTGQRKGLGLPDATPWYVLQLDAESNRLIVCKKDALYAGKIVVRDVMWSDAAQTFPWKGKVQIRGRHRAADATVAPGGDGKFFISFASGQRAATPGQFAVFYSDDDCVVGSGIIDSQKMPERKAP